MPWMLHQTRVNLESDTGNEKIVASGTERPLIGQCFLADHEGTCTLRHRSILIGIGYANNVCINKNTTFPYSFIIYPPINAIHSYKKNIYYESLGKVKNNLTKDFFFINIL